MPRFAERLDLQSFHPLKAGRRLIKEFFDLWRILVSIPSRRVGDGKLSELMLKKSWGFHPLKAGRRRFWASACPLQGAVFPSPQGGSETGT